MSIPLPDIAMPKIDLPRKPRYVVEQFPLPDKQQFNVGAQQQAPARVFGSDEFGLDLTIYGRYPRKSREYAAKALEYFGYPKNQNPQAFVFGGGTIPEMVVVGGLLARGYAYGQRGPKGFGYQIQVLGGRAISGGGAVEDIVVYIGSRVIAVPVNSAFHGAILAFGGGLRKVYSDREQAIKVQSRGKIDKVVSVNDWQRGAPLENGPDAAVDGEFLRIERA